MAHIVKTSSNTLIKKKSSTDITQQSFISFKKDVQENRNSIQSIKNQTINTDIVYTDSETGTKYKIYIKDGEVTLEEVE